MKLTKLATVAATASMGLVLFAQANPATAADAAARGAAPAATPSVTLCTGSDCLDTLLQLRPPFAWHKPGGLQGVT